MASSKQLPKNLASPETPYAAYYVITFLAAIVYGCDSSSKVQDICSEGIGQPVAK